MKFYKRDPDRALAGMAELTLQERGAYNTIIDALYSRDGVLRDDDELLRRLMGCHGNELRAVKKKLIACGKVWIEDGYIKAKGVDSTLNEAENFSETQRKRAGKRWEIERKTATNAEKSEQKQQTDYAKDGNALTLTPTPIEKKDSVANATDADGVVEAGSKEHDRLLFRLARKAGRPSAPTEFRKLGMEDLRIEMLLRESLGRAEPRAYLAGILTKQQARDGPKHWNDHGTETGMSPTLERLILDEQRNEDRDCNAGAALLAADPGTDQRH